MVRAIYEWCCDNGFTPYLAVSVDARTRVPMEFVRDGQIVLNISPDATNKLNISNELVTFQARFGGVARDISVPFSNIAAIYARESGAGMAFDLEEEADNAAAETVVLPEPPEPEPTPPPARPKLQRIK
jgi:stringent starvation protein B